MTYNALWLLYMQHLSWKLKSLILQEVCKWTSEQHYKTNKMARAPGEDSDQSGLPPSFRLWSHWADVQADMCLRWTHIWFCWFWHAAAQVILVSIRNEQTNNLCFIETLRHQLAVCTRFWGVFYSSLCNETVLCHNRTNLGTVELREISLTSVFAVRSVSS